MTGIFVAFHCLSKKLFDQSENTLSTVADISVKHYH